MVLGKTINCPFKYQHEVLGKAINCPPKYQQEIKKRSTKEICGPWKDHKMHSQTINNNQEKVTNGPWQDHKLHIENLNKDSKYKKNQQMVIGTTTKLPTKILYQDSK
ncbi:hypothetical protein O181_128008 [Austropuccinia psidii MF-1]|uniref:Uncharacterized protein n=1 Tax=Austropuccinia psidii MF-1 TaxID=1389203 RepID=A0A9Q3KVF7_9BASI|nr:hypothetical protein [Austropuccinia psidii MF-1]